MWLPSVLWSVVVLGGRSGPAPLLLSAEVSAANGVTVCGQCSQEHLPAVPRPWKDSLPFLRNSLLLGDSLPPHPETHRVPEEKALPKQDVRRAK